jgi:hypothetical protein
MRRIHSTPISTTGAFTKIIGLDLEVATDKVLGKF